MKIWFLVFQEIFLDGTGVKEELKDEKTEEPEASMFR
jgi:hypothetical protein